VARPGAFSANFDPATLDQFRSFCSARGEKYTKILEQLAVLYMQSAGDVLHKKAVKDTGTGSIPSTATSPSGSSTKELENRLNKLEESDEFNAETFETIFQRLIEVEKVTKTGQFRK